MKRICLCQIWDRVKALPFSGEGFFFTENLADSRLNTPVLDSNKGLFVLGLLRRRKCQTSRGRGVQVTRGDRGAGVAREEGR